MYCLFILVYLVSTNHFTMTTLAYLFLSYHIFPIFIAGIFSSHSNFVVNVSFSFYFRGLLFAVDFFNVNVSSCLFLKHLQEFPPAELLAITWAHYYRSCNLEILPDLLIYNENYNYMRISVVTQSIFYMASW